MDATDADWQNDLENDHKNPTFNAYLEDQPGSNVEDGWKSKIIIKNVRTGMTEKGIRNLCSEYGDVCSVVRGTISSHYFFVIFGSPDQAQYAIEKINRLYHPMRAEFAKSRDRNSYIDFNHVKPIVQQPPEDKEIQMSNKRVFKLPFIQKMPFEMPARLPALTTEDYSTTELIKIDDSLNFFNEFSVCDIFTDHDIGVLEKNAKSHELVRGAWTFKPGEVEVSQIKKSLAMSAGEIDIEKEMHRKTHSKFELISGCIGSCKTCGRVSVRQTKNTKEFYCSIICKKNKKITADTNKSNSSLNEDFKLPLVELSNRGNVVITAVINQNTVYVRPSDIESTAVYYHNLLKVSLLSENAGLILKLPKPGDLVAVNVQGDNYLRAIVLKIVDSENIRVAYLDTGSVSIQKLKNLRKLKSELKSLPIYVQKITLDGISTDYICTEAIVDLNRYICADKARDLEIRFENIFQGARLYDHNECINDDIQDLITINVPSGDGYKKSDYIGHKDLVVKTEKELIILDNSMLLAGAIACIEKDNFIKLQLLHEKVQHYGASLKDNSAYAPRHEEVCLVHLNGVWFRGICIEIIGDRHPTIQCIDFGFYAIVVVTDIKKIPDSLLDICFTGTFTIDGFDPEKHISHMNKILDRFSPLQTMTVQKCEEDKIYSSDVQEFLSNLNNLPQINENQTDDSAIESEVD